MIETPTHSVTFYSYKGGVGRSMAVLNVAYSLASRGRAVLVLDMDLEAPGLSGFLGRIGELSGRSRLDMLDLVSWAVSEALARQGSADEGNFPTPTGVPISEYIAPVDRASKLDVAPLKPQLGEVGRIDVIAIHEDRDYFDRLEIFHRAVGALRDLGPTGQILKDYLKSGRYPIEVPDYYGPDAPRDAPYDHILIDSRTGLTETGGLCIGPLADRLVVLTGLNDQNLEGTRAFLELVGITTPREQIDNQWDNSDVPPSSPQAPPRLGPKPTLLVASPVPVGEVDYKRQCLKQLRQKLGGEVAATISYHPLLALRETVFVRDYRDEYLADQYLALTDRIMAAVGDHYAQLSAHSQRVIVQKGPALSALVPILKLVPHEPSLGSFLLRQFAADFRPADDEEFRAADRAYRTLMQAEHIERADPYFYFRWGYNLANWSERSAASPFARDRLEEAIARFTTASARADALADLRAKALFNRGVARGRAGDAAGELADYEAVLAMPDAPADHRAKALVNRGVVRGRAGDAAGELADYEEVLAMPDAPAEPRAGALINRGLARGRAGDAAGGLADYEEVLAMSDASAESRAAALFNRGLARGRAGDAAGELADYDAVLDLPDAPVERRAEALVNRGVARGRAGDATGELADYCAVLTMSNAPADQRAKALVNRGGARGRAGDAAGAMADYGAVLDMPNAPTGPRAWALFNRGVARGRAGDTVGKLADYDAVLAMPDAPADQRAKALGNVAWEQYLNGDYSLSIGSSRRALEIKPDSAYVLANLGLAILHVESPEAASREYQLAIAVASGDELNEMEKDLREALAKRPDLPGAAEILDRIQTRRGLLSNDERRTQGGDTGTDSGPSQARRGTIQPKRM